MRISEFFAHVKAELAGGKIKTFYQGVHHIIAEVIDGNPQLTETGRQLKSDIEAALPIVGNAVKDATDDLIEQNAPGVASVLTPVVNAAEDQAMTNLIHPTSDDTSSAGAKPVPVNPDGVDVTGAPPRTTKAKKA